MTGRVIEVLVSEGDPVNSGDIVVVVESMKMENEIICDHDGTISAIHVQEDQSVSEGDQLAVVTT